MSEFVYLLAPSVFLYLAAYYGLFRPVRCTSPARLEGRTVLITGRPAGLSRAAAVDLARRGARVVVACSSKQTCEAAVYDIRRESGNNQVVSMQLHLNSLQSVRSFAETFLKTEPRLDILVNTAGVVGPGLTLEGFGSALGVNHLAPFLLTDLLLGRLQHCGPSRVVTVASHFHHFGKINFSDLASNKDFVAGQSGWNAIQSYCSSKLCNVLFTRELANRLDGTQVTCYCLHPGLLSSVLWELCGSLSPWLQVLVLPLAGLFCADPEGAAQTVLHCCLQEGLEPFSGRYFSNCVVAAPGCGGQDDALAEKLWEVSQRLTSTGSQTTTTASLTY